MKIGNLEVYGIIYKVTNNINGKVYIGQTTLKNGFKDRYRCSKDNPIEKIYYTYLPKTKKENKSLYNRHLFYSIEKYGFEAFNVVEIFDVAFSKTELDIKEDSWIVIYDSINNGYNNRRGGSNGKLSEESKIKSSMTWIEKYNNGYISPNLGRKHTEEWKKNMSVVNKGENNAMYGVSPQERMDSDTYEKWRTSISKSVTRGKNPFASKVVCLETKKVYDCVKDAEEENKITGISAVCRKVRFSTHNTHWVYYDEYINMNEEEIENIYNLDRINKENNKNKSKKKIICLNTNEIFDSVIEARLKYGCDSHISDCLKGKRKYCGRLKNGTRLKWMYYEEYLK